MRTLLYLSCLVALLSAVSCRPAADIRAAEAKAQWLVGQRATTNQVAEAFGAAPIHIYTRSEALKYLGQQPSSEQWKSMSQYPMAYEFTMQRAGGWVLVYFDDEGRAASYYVNIQ